MIEQNYPEEKKPGLLHNVWVQALLANIVGFSFIGLITLLKQERVIDDGTAVFFLFLFSPLLIGGILGFMHRKEYLSLGKQVKLNAISLVFTLFFSTVLLQEGVFCLIIISPLILISTSVGTIIVYYLLRRTDKKLRVSVGVVMIMFFVLNMTAISKIQEQVTDEVTIKASPDKVWKYVASFPTITDEPDFWMFKLGMPMPIATTVSEHAQGGSRKCIFSRGLVFDEVMTVFKPNEELTFSIVAQPPDPEILGHIDLQKGQFLLRANSDGTTTLVGTSWYTLRVFPTWYFNPWAETITRNVHLRVMEHIKQLAEQEMQTASNALH